MSDKSHETNIVPTEKEQQDKAAKPVYKKPELRKYGQIDRVTFS